MRTLMPILALLLVLFAARVPAKQPRRTQPDSLVAVVLHDGTRLQGRIVAQTAEQLVVVTIGGLEVRVPRSSVASITPIRGRVVRGEFRSADPNYSRLLYTPTGRPLKGGDGYFADHWVFFPSVAYGITDHFSVLGGMSLIPAVGFGEQMKYLVPRIGAYLSEDVALSLGTLYVHVAGEGGGIAFATGTVGPQDRSLTAGVGLPYVGEGEHLTDVVILTLGGNMRLSNSIALITENWLFFGGGERFQLYSLAVRLFGGRLSGDFGIVFSKELLEAGFPLPWLSITYAFSR